MHQLILQGLEDIVIIAICIILWYINIIIGDGAELDHVKLMTPAKRHSYVFCRSLFFLVLDRSWISYIVIDTIMMAAFGIFDPFWWSIIGELLDYAKNAAKLLGLGLSANVLGIKVMSISQVINSVVLALIIAFTILMILPFLNKHLSSIIK